MARALCGAVPGDYPVFVKPNAGLPRADGSGYDITPQLFAMQMKPYRELGLFAAGGCCGTTPDFIRALHRVFDGCAVGREARPLPSVLCTPVQRVVVDGITVVGERINPTGKKRFQQALREGDMDYVLAQAISQAESGAAVLDVNVGAPGVDEPALMEQVVKALQSVVSLPLQLDSSNAAALERGAAGLQRQAHRQLGERGAGGAGQAAAPVQKIRRGGGGPDHGRTRHPQDRRRAGGHRRPHPGRGPGRRHPPRGHLHRLPHPDRQRPAEGRHGHPGRPARLQGRTGGAHRAGGVQHQLWAALPALPEHHLFDHGHVRRAGPGHHEPRQRGDDGGGLCLWRPVGAGQAERAVHRPVRPGGRCRPRRPSPPRRKRLPRKRRPPAGPTPP